MEERLNHYIGTLRSRVHRLRKEAEGESMNGWIRCTENNQRLGEAV